MPSNQQTEQEMRVISGRNGLLDSLAIRFGELLSVDARGAITHIRALLNDITQAVTTANLGFGQQFLSFEKGLIQPLAARVEYDLASDGTATLASGEVGIGTVVASGAVNTLATATFEDFMEGQAITALAAATPQTDEIFAGGVRTSPLDGLATAKDLFLNFAVDGGVGGDVTFSNIVVDLIFNWMPQAPLRG